MLQDYVSVTGITGQNSAKIKNLKTSIKSIKNETNLPVLVGFGIKNISQARTISNFSDGIIIGSAIVSIIEKYFFGKFTKNKLIKNISSFVNSFSKVIN